MADIFSCIVFAMNIHLVLHGLKVSKVMLSIVFMHFVLSGYVLAYFTEHFGSPSTFDKPNRNDAAGPSSFRASLA